MDLTYVLMRRAAAISLAALLAVLMLAAWRAQSDVRREGQGAAELARLARALAGLQSVAAERLDGQIREVAAMAGAGALRHLQFRLSDAASGELLAQSAADPEPAAGARQVMRALGLYQAPRHPNERFSWQLEREDGRTFDVTLETHPQSEQQEAFGNILGVAALLAGYALALLFAIYWAVRHAFQPLRELLGTIAAFERQDYGARLPELPVRELNVIGRSLNHLAAALARLEQERRLLSLKLLGLQEEERARIARELHDELGQSLTAMRADATYLCRRSEALPELQAVARGLEGQCAQVQQDVRRLLQWLSNSGEAGGDGVPLPALLESLVASWSQRPGQNVDYRLEIDPGAAELPRGLAMNLYRMTQEALTNVSRHADARAVRIRLQARAGEPLRWSVCDDGRGIDALEEAFQRGLGLAGMRERVWAHGGELLIEPVPPPGRGLNLRAEFPWPAEDPE